MNTWKVCEVWVKSEDRNQDIYIHICPSASLLNLCSHRLLNSMARIDVGTQVRDARVVIILSPATFN